VTVPGEVLLGNSSRLKMVLERRFEELTHRSSPNGFGFRRSVKEGQTRLEREKQPQKQRKKAQTKKTRLGIEERGLTEQSPQGQRRGV